MQEREKLREQANLEYLKERAQVDAIISRMVEEDMA
jgi:hypothetical protein